MSELDALKEAVKLKTALDRIDAQQAAAAAAVEEKFQAKRNALYETAAPEAVRVLTRMGSEVAG